MSQLANQPRLEPKPALKPAQSESSSPSPLPSPQTGLSAPLRSLQRNTATVVLTAAGLLVLLYVLWTARTVLLILFAGVLLAVMLRAAAAWLEERLHVPRKLSLAIVVAGTAAILALGIWLRGPAVEAQIDQLQQRLPQAAGEFSARLGSQQWGRWLVDHGFGTDQLPRALDLLPRVTGVLSSTLGFLASVVIVLFLGIVMAAEPEVYCKGVEKLFRPESRAYIGSVISEIGRTLRWWLVARLISMCAVGVMAFLGLRALGIPLAGTLGVLASLLAFIPNVGPILSAIPPMLLAFSSSPQKALLVIGLFCAIHAIEGFLVTPLVERAAVRLPPALTLSMQMLLAIVAGPAGIALAAPFTTVAMVLFRNMYLHEGTPAAQQQ
jgi:predicted PurR-regulated permease PerM